MSQDVQPTTQSGAISGVRPWPISYSPIVSYSGIDRLRATSDGQSAQLLQRPYTIYVYEILEAGRWLGQESNAASSSQDVSRNDLVLCRLPATRDLHRVQHLIGLKDTLDGENCMQLSA